MFPAVQDLILRQSVLQFEMMKLKDVSYFQSLCYFLGLFYLGDVVIAGTAAPQYNPVDLGETPKILSST